MFEQPKVWWKCHGTKIIGAVTYLTGLLAFIDHETVQLIKEALGPVWGARAAFALMILAGLVTAKRGYTNSQRNASP